MCEGYNLSINLLTNAVEGPNLLSENAGHLCFVAQDPFPRSSVLDTCYFGDFLFYAYFIWIGYGPLLRWVAENCAFFFPSIDIGAGLKWVREHLLKESNYDWEGLHVLLLIERRVCHKAIPHVFRFRNLLHTDFRLWFLTCNLFPSS